MYGPKIHNHENSNEHRINMFKWKCFSKNNIINCTCEIEIKRQKDKWKHILKVVIDCVRLLSKQFTLEGI